MAVFFRRIYPLISSEKYFKLFPLQLQLVSCQSTISPGEKDDVELVPERLYSKINIKVQSYEHPVLDSYMKFVLTAGKALGINIGGKAFLPTRIQKFTVLKSPHIYKKHRGQYEIRTHSRLVQIKEITGTTADVFLEYIQRNLPEGVTMTVYQESLNVLPKLLMNHLTEEQSKLDNNTKKKQKK
jgi:small subunit ribosomal protein S10